MSTHHHLTRSALVVGIYQYDNLSMSQQLKKLSKQAEQLAQALERQGGFRVERLPCSTENTLDLKARVTLPQLEHALEQLLYPKNSSPQTILLFFVGHGLIKVSPLGPEGFLATSEVDGESLYGLSLKTLRELLYKSPVKQQLVFLEASYSGELFRDFEADDKHDCYFVTSTQGYSEGELSDGLLTQALLEAFNSKQYSKIYLANKILPEIFDNIQEGKKNLHRFMHQTCGEPIQLKVRRFPKNQIIGFIVVLFIVFLVFVSKTPLDISPQEGFSSDGVPSCWPNIEASPSLLPKEHQSFNGRNKWTEVSYFDKNTGEKIHRGDGVHKIMTTYRDGKKIEIAYFDVNDEPTLSEKMGVHKVKRKYDGNNMVEEAYFDVLDQPALSKTCGFHTVKIKYDDHQREVGREFW